MIEQKDSEILELAGFADRNRKAREVHSEPIFDLRDYKSDALCHI